VEIHSYKFKNVIVSEGNLHISNWIFLQILV